MASARRDGATLLFDPSGTVRTPPGVRRIGYSPIAPKSLLGRCGSRLAQPDRRRVDAVAAIEVTIHWTERAGALVAPLLHARALRGESLGRTGVARRRATLRRRRARTDASATASTIRRCRYFAAFSRPKIASVRVSGRPRRDSSRACAPTRRGRPRARRHSTSTHFLSGPHQLHIVAPSRHQAVTTPLVVGLIEEVVHATYDRHDEGARLLLALDELANVAPLPRLASIVSEGGGQGVLTLACLQDLSQARSRWGDLGRRLPLALPHHRRPSGHRGPPHAGDAPTPRRTLARRDAQRPVRSSRQARRATPPAGSSATTHR